MCSIHMCILGSKSGIQNKVETFYVHHFNVETVIHASDCFLLPFGLLAIKLCLHPQLCVCVLYVHEFASEHTHVHTCRGQSRTSGIFLFHRPPYCLETGTGSLTELEACCFVLDWLRMRFWDVPVSIPKY